MYFTASVVLFKTDTEVLNKLLYSFFYQNNFECIFFIVDNSPFHLDVKKIINDPRIVYIKNKKNLGYGRAHNIAIKKAEELQSKYHFVFNPDVYFENDVLGVLINYIKSDDTIGQVMPKLVYPNGKLQYSCRLIPTPFDLLIRRFLPSYVLAKRKKKHQLEFADYDSEMEVPFLLGCCMLLNMKAIQDVGDFDERFFLYAEDLDLTRRINEKYKTMYYPQVTIVHNYARESYKFGKMLLIHIVNMVRYFNKWGWLFDKKRKLINQKTINNLTK